MASCTKEQVMKWNEKLQNGFRFDLRCFLMRNDKTAVKVLDLSDGRKLQAKLEYREERENWRTIGQQPVLHLSIWEVCENSDFMKSSGMGVDVRMGAMQTKKNYNVLCNLSGTVTDEQILNLANEHMGRLNNPFILG